MKRSALASPTPAPPTPASPTLASRTLAPAALALVGGLAWGLAFQATPRPWLAIVGFVPILLLLDRPRAMRWTFLAGVVSWLVAMPWIAATLETFGGLPAALSFGLFLLLTLVLGLDFLVFAWLGRRLWRHGRMAAWLGLPGLWVVIEQARGFFVHGFPWNLAAYAWTDLPGALPLASWIGAAGVSYLVVLVNVAIALGLRYRRFAPSIGVLLAVASLLVLGGRFGPTPFGDGTGVELRVIQPNTGMTLDEQAILDGYAGLLDLSLQACDEPALLVWPESAAWPFGWQGSPRLRGDVQRLVRAGCPVLLGSPLRDAAGDRVENAAFVVGSEGAGPAYAKRRLVPWGEYVPGKDLLPFIGKLARHAGDFSPGDDVALIDLAPIGLAPIGLASSDLTSSDLASSDQGTAGERLGLAICYEVIFPLPVAEQVRAGATILMSITNDSWYGDSSAPWQHLRAARWRAAENQRPMVRAALTGVSAIIDRRGQVVDALGVDARGSLAFRVVGSSDLAPFSRAPWAPVLISGLLVGFAIMRVPRRPLTEPAPPTASEPNEPVHSDQESP